MKRFLLLLLLREQSRLKDVLRPPLLERAIGVMRLVHCAPDWIVIGDLPAMLPDDQPAREELAREAERLRAGGIVVVEEMRRGIASLEIEILVHHNIAAAICGAAASFGADVICMGTKGHSRTGVALLGSTVQGVLAQAHKPVLAVTAPFS